MNTTPQDEHHDFQTAPAQEVASAPSKSKADKLKFLAMFGGGVYGFLLILIFVWAALRISVLGRFLMGLSHVLFGLLLFGTLVLVGYGIIKLIKSKSDPSAKKQASKLTLFGALGFLGAALLWLLGIWFLSPRLTPVQYYESPIVTSPADLVGLSAPVDVTFDASSLPVDTSVYRILSYNWDFGDGSTGSGSMLTHRYTSRPADGRYDVTLLVSYMDLKSGEQFEQEFTTFLTIENETVAAIFTATPDSGNPPLDVEFDASASYDPDGSIVGYEWDLDGDGKFDDGDEVLVSYEYENEGSFEVSLRVTDNNGETNVSTQTIEVGSVDGLRAVITTEVQSDESYLTGEKYEFDASNSQFRDDRIVKYVWNFDDGSGNVESRSTSHIFEEAGTYEIQLGVYDSDGNSHLTTLEITVVDSGSKPSAKITANTLGGPIPLEIDFDGSASSDPDDDIIEYAWDFDGDDKIDETGQFASYTYDEIGDYEVTLIVTDSAGNESSTSVDITATEQGVLAKMDVSPNNGEVPLTVTFDASDSSYKEGNIVAYEYDFGDGSDPYVGGSKISYKYSSVGTFTATLTVTGDDGETASTSVQVVVRPVSITACFDVNKASGAAPIFVSVDPSCSTGAIKSYSWDFGDGDVSFDRKPDVHTYDKAGTYTITLEVTSDGGVVDVFEKDIVVK